MAAITQKIEKKNSWQAATVGGGGLKECFFLATRGPEGLNDVTNVQ